MKFSSSKNEFGFMLSKITSARGNAVCKTYGLTYNETSIVVKVVIDEVMVD